MIWIEAEDIILIHRRIIQATGGADGLRDRAGLEAALAAPLQSFGGRDLFPSDIEKIARLGYGLAANHAFMDGNKRSSSCSGTATAWSCGRGSWRICLSPLPMAARRTGT